MTVHHVIKHHVDPALDVGQYHFDNAHWVGKFQKSQSLLIPIQSWRAFKTTPWIAGDENVDVCRLRARIKKRKRQHM